MDRWKNCPILRPGFPAASSLVAYDSNAAKDEPRAGEEGQGRIVDGPAGLVPAGVITHRRVRPGDRDSGDELFCSQRGR